MPKNNINDIINKLSDDISNVVGNVTDNDILAIDNEFDTSLGKALDKFNSGIFDNDGFLHKMGDMEFSEKNNKDVLKNILNGVTNMHMHVHALNQTELSVRRDIYNICKQMPEMRDVVYIIRDAVIESNTATGIVSRTLQFENQTTDVASNTEAIVKEIEKRHKTLMAIKNFLVPNTLMMGEVMINVIPYNKLFAELEINKKMKHGYQENTAFLESVPHDIINSFNGTINLKSEKNIKLITESVSRYTKDEIKTDNDIEHDNDSKSIAINDDSNKYIGEFLEHIEVSRGSSTLMDELSLEGFEEFIKKEYREYSMNDNTKSNTFFEFMDDYGKKFTVDDDPKIANSYSNIKGCYNNYVDGLRMLPIRIGNKVVGYVYSTTVIDIDHNQITANGIVDLSFRKFSNDRNIVDKLAGLIIKTFDKKMLEKNIKLKEEIADILIAHKFSQGKLKFTFIPEDEVVRFVINEDEDGKGHSVLEPSVVPARNHLLLNLYNMLYVLNNNTTRIYYLKSSGMNKDYASQIQRTMRKFQSRRINADDIYSYDGALNKLGGMTEMVLPAGRGDYKAIETETLEAVPNPINIEFLEQQRRYAISGTGVPQFMVLNAIDEVDFAKQLEMSNARFISTASSYKIDMNDGVTKWYQLMMKYDTDIEADIIKSFRFAFNTVKHQDLNITVEMAQNFNTVVELVGSLKYQPDELQDENGKPTYKGLALRMELAKIYLPQLDFDTLNDVYNRIEVNAAHNEVIDKASGANITTDEVDEFTNEQ